ncbi:thiol reductant ABC exporter subunit CydC [Salinisphaera hydrothermalis]|uniref:Cysteine export CydDC family ABC transporter permease/ATP-binding protein CydC n=1 Tax=Salinisphaera hydrothermalis (strain C41B8) TaxID=1304275 RepID=A0A084IJC1_SALHC|nr:thiol reductant ABC exporter subunit CydC [Salinisphaera hydrothermalis]KEZ76805.1 cysteine export CydDC family ABC transporter permease/ATP-binding protein CydC [Salinisphaera hydrothermalis C41B8]
MSDLRWWLQLARPYRGAFALGIALGIVTVASNMALLAVSGWFIASMAVAGLAAADMNYFTPAAAIRGLAIARTGGRYLERLVTHDATLKLLTGLRVWFYRQVEPLSANQLSGLRGGDLLARVRADIDTLSAVYLQLILPVTVGVVCVAGAVCVWAWYSVAVALTNLALLIAAGGLLPWWVARAGRAPGAASVAVAARLKTQLVDMVEGLGELVVFGAFTARAREIAELTEQHLDEQARLSRLTGLGQAGILLLTNVAVLASIGLIVPSIRSGALAPVDFAPVVLLVLASVEAVAQMPGAWQALGQLQATTRRLRAFEALHPAIVEPETPRPAPMDHRLIFERVFVRHAPDAPWALADATLSIAPGEHVAVVGASGAGKSSLVHLLTRMTVPERGTVYWGGAPVAAYRSADLRAAIALVPQQIYLFHASVADNIAVGDPDADENAIISAAKAAAIHDEIMALPEGYDTLVGEEGLRLSGGQIRRIGIARALLRDAPVVIMDEPGEGLDSATAARLWAAASPRLAGRTLILVSHQPEWVAHCPRVVVLDRGRLVGDGAPGELADTCAEYRRLTHPGYRLDSDQRSTPRASLTLP